MHLLGFCKSQNYEFIGDQTTEIFLDIFLRLKQLKKFART